MIPLEFRAGDTLAWTESLASYPATTYTLKYKLAGPAQITLTSTASGSDHAFSVAASATAAYVSGVYEWTAYVVDKATGLVRYTLTTGRLEILADLVAQTAAVDSRSTARVVFENLAAVIKNRSTKGYETMTIGGRSITQLSWGELLTAYHHFERLVKAEERADKIAAGAQAGGKILTRFDTVS